MLRFEPLLFLSAFLLFGVQPLMGALALPVAIPGADTTARGVGLLQSRVGCRPGDLCVERA